MKKILGDLVRDAKKFEVIVHGCNCFHTMGSGIARQVREVFPETYEADLKTTIGDESKLGSISYVEYDDLTVVNAYTQFNYGAGEINVDYSAIRNAMRIIKSNYSGKKIGIPMIGAGLAGGDWNIIKNIIDDELCDEDVTLVILEKDVDMYYDVLLTDVVEMYSDIVVTYKTGKRGLIGLFTAQAMKDSCATLEPKELLRRTYDYLNSK
jgi:O-acetyl-ADP-ribose deacetylase (regulator of RNase III)